MQHVQHDRAYQRVNSQPVDSQPINSRDQLTPSDAVLRGCQGERETSTLAEFMYRSGRLRGSPLLPTWYRSIHGWDYSQSEQADTPSQQPRAHDVGAARTQVASAAVC